MKPFRRCQRILILALLSLSVFAPILFVSQRLKNLNYTGISIRILIVCLIWGCVWFVCSEWFCVWFWIVAGRKEFVEDLSNIVWIFAPQISVLYFNLNLLIFALKMREIDIYIYILWMGCVQDQSFWLIGLLWFGCYWIDGVVYCSGDLRWVLVFLSAEIQDW